VPANDPYGRPIYWLTVTQLQEHAEDTDLWAFERGYITITPLEVDITDNAYLDKVGEDERVVEFAETPAKVEKVVAEAHMREAESAD
jgi:broad specificity polyphosphatase/5'/3'-nucleotidase SurE